MQVFQDLRPAPRHLSVQNRFNKYHTTDESFKQYQLLYKTKLTFGEVTGRDF